MDISDRIDSVKELDEALAQPYPELVEMMSRLDGDIMILGVGGKMGPSLAHLAVNACREAGISKRIIGVSRFSDKKQQERLDSLGVETIACDLLDLEAVNDLPKVKNILYMAGRKFGEAGSESLTWMMNVVVPSHVGSVFSDSRIVIFSTGCVYGMVASNSTGSLETDTVRPDGEYANSCLGRERVFEYFSRLNGTLMLQYRLNYAIDLRYGVLVDIAQTVRDGKPLDLSVETVNIIWQGDANNRALLCLEHTHTPPAVLNITGSEVLYVRDLAQRFAEIFNVEAKFIGSDIGKTFLSDAGRSTDLFGEPKASVDQMVKWVAEWLKMGGEVLGKPTLFQITDGDFLKK